MEPLKMPEFTKMNFQIASGIDELGRFMEGSIYGDFVKELDVRIMQLHELLEDGDLHYAGRNYDVFRGGIQCMRQMKDIFICLRDAKEDQLNINDAEPRGATE